ncbi:MAG: RNA polymerase sporulation sigma factor SigH [Lachnospiraceae bacterium]|nr:RNA polymerase sporulation sigma factor SigH [Lachnospiraceae bacterium]
MIDFEKHTDEELILLFQDGEKSVEEYLLNKYKNMVRKKAGSMYILGGDRDDLIQEGMIGLFKAMRDYDIGRDASFASFADLCVSRQMYTAVQAARRKKHAPLNTYVSLSGSGENEADSEKKARDILEAIPSLIEKNPEELVIDQENLELLQQKIEQELSSFEKQILDLYITGMTYSQIAKVLGRDEKSTDNGLSRVKMKLKKLLG